MIKRSVQTVAPSAPHVQLHWLLPPGHMGGGQLAAMQARASLLTVAGKSLSVVVVNVARLVGLESGCRLFDVLFFSVSYCKFMCWLD